MRVSVLYFSAAGALALPLTSLAALEGLTQLVNDVKTAISVAVIVVFSIAVLVFGWGIVKYLTAAGDATKVKDARVFLWWGIIGMFVLAAIFGIITFIGDQIGITPGGQQIINVPTVTQ